MKKINGVVIENSEWKTEGCAFQKGNKQELRPMKSEGNQLSFEELMGAYGGAGKA